MRLILNTSRKISQAARHVFARGLVAGMLATTFATGLGGQGPALAAPSTYVDITNFQPRYSGTGTWDWGNGSTGLSGVHSTGPNACTVTTNTGGTKTISCPGTNGLFNGGTWNGNTTP